MNPELEDNITPELDAVETQQKLITVLHDLEEEVEKQNSWQRTFLRGALYGLGTVVGATILIAILGSVLAVAANTFGIDNVPFVGDLIQKLISTAGK
jgi:hypothetical protein